MTTYLLATAVIFGAFTLIGIGIIFFGRKDIGGDCHKAPEERENGCLSKDLGICPMEDPDGYMQMARSTSQLKNIKKY